MAATARAEARRKAILGRKGDRLAKLTSSARGEDAPAYMTDDSSTFSASRNFLGDESSDMPTPDRPSPSPSPRAARTSASPSPSRNPFESAGLGAGAMPDPSVWSAEQQQQFMRALMGGMGTPQEPLPQSPLGDPSAPIDARLAPLDNPFAAMLFPPGPQKAPNLHTQEKVPLSKASVRLQKAMPLLHIAVMWCLLAYFVIWKEPHVYGDDTGIFYRWAGLNFRNPLKEGEVRIPELRPLVQMVPFFWAFTTAQLVLHSLRIFSGFDTVQPSTIMSLVLPQLPPQFQSIIINFLKYMQMGHLFLDDLAGLVVGIGFIVYFAGQYAT